MAISDKAVELTEAIYYAYGSDRGYLFGIEPSKRSAVQVVVQVVLEMVEKENSGETGYKSS